MFVLLFICIVLFGWVFDWFSFDMFSLSPSFSPINCSGENCTNESLVNGSELNETLITEPNLTLDNNIIGANLTLESNATEENSINMTANFTGTLNNTNESGVLSYQNSSENQTLTDQADNQTNKTEIDITIEDLDEDIGNENDIINNTQEQETQTIPASPSPGVDTGTSDPDENFQESGNLEQTPDMQTPSLSEPTDSDIKTPWTYIFGGAIIVILVVVALFFSKWKNKTTGLYNVDTASLTQVG